MTGIQGIQAAAITPRGRNGEIDLCAVFELIDFLSKSGVQGIVLFAAAGEYASVTDDDRTRVTYLAVKRSRVPVLAGVGSATLDSSIALARGAREAGAAAVLLPPPYFFRYQQDDLREFYCQFTAHTGSGYPTWIMNTPACTSTIEVPTALELMATGNYAGLVDASGSTDSLLKLRAAGPCETLAGSDAVFTQSRFAGACGGVSEAACAAPELMVALNRAIAAGRQREVESLDARLQEFVGWMNRFPQPVIAKFATGLRGLKTGPLPVPLGSEKQRKLDEFREWFQGWLPAVRNIAAGA